MHYQCKEKKQEPKNGGYTVEENHIWS